MHTADSKIFSNNIFRLLAAVVLFTLVENIAFKKETWLNKERHRKRALEGVYDPWLSEKLSQKAVDGVTVNDINSCTILDSYYDDEPQLTIDLGVRYDVAGVIIYTWQGQKDGQLIAISELKTG